MTQNELVTGTKLARENYWQCDTLVSRMLFEFWYMLLGMEA